MGGLDPEDDANRTAVAGCEMFDQETNEWTRLPSMTVERDSHVAIAKTLFSGTRIYVFGGFGANNAAGYGCYLDSCEYLDIGNDTWTMMDVKMTTPRGDSAGVLLNPTTLVFCAGDDGEEITSKCESFDLDSHTFSPFPDMLGTRAQHAAVLYKGSIVVIGGEDHDWTELSTCEQFDPNENQWKPFSPLNEPIKLPGAVVVEDKIFIVDRCHEVDIYDGISWSTVQHTIGCGSPYSIFYRGMVVVFDPNNGTPSICDFTTMTGSVLPSPSVPRGLVVAVSF